MTSRPADVIERLQRLRKIMTEEVNLEKKVCKIKNKRDLDPNITLDRLSPIPQEQAYQPLKKSSRNSVSKSKNETKYNYPQKTAPIRRKKSPDLRKSSTQRISSREKAAIQTLTEYKESRPKSLTRSKRASSSHRKMKNAEVQTGTDIRTTEINYKNSHFDESEKLVTEMHQDRLKRYFFGIWLRQRLRAERHRMDNSLKKRGTSTSREDQYYTESKHRTRHVKDKNKYSHKNDEYIDYYNNENVNNNPKAKIRRRSSSKKSERIQTSSSQRKNSVSSSLRTGKYQTDYIIETDKCKTKVKRQPTNVLESEITRLLKPKKQHIRAISPIRSKTTIVKKSRRKSIKASSKPKKQSKLAYAEPENKYDNSNYNHQNKNNDNISYEEEYDDIEVENYIQRHRQQKQSIQTEEQERNRTNHYGYIPKDNDLFDDRFLSKPKMPSRTTYDEIIDQIEEQQKNQKQINFINNDSNSVSSSNSINNIGSGSESLSNIQKVQGNNHRIEEASSDFLNLSFPEEKHTTEINSFDVNDLGIKKNGSKKNTSNNDDNLISPKKANSSHMVATTTIRKDSSLEDRKKKAQEIKAKLEKIQQENYLFSSSDESDTEDKINKPKMPSNNQQHSTSISTTKTTTTTTTSTTTKIVKDEEKEMQSNVSITKKPTKNINSGLFNSDVLFSSENIEKMINDEFDSEFTKGMNRFPSESSFSMSTDKSKQTLNSSVVKPQKQKQFLYVKTSKHILDEFIEEEEEEDFDINKYLSDEYREIPENKTTKNGNRIDYSDIELNKEKVKKIEKIISDDFSLSFNDDNEKVNKTAAAKIESNILDMIEEEEEEQTESNEINHQVEITISTTKQKEESKIKTESKLNNTKDDKAFSSNLDFNDDFAEEEEEDFQIEEDEKESNLMKEELNKVNKSSDEIADLMLDNSSDFLKESKEQNKNDISDNDDIIDDLNEEEVNEQSTEKVEQKDKTGSGIDIDIDDLLEGNDKKEAKTEIQKSNSDIEIAVDDFEDESDTENKTQTQTKVQGVTKESRFPFKTDFEVNVDDLSSDNLEEQQKLEYELLPPTSLTEALGLGNEESNKTANDSSLVNKTKTSSDDLLDDLINDISEQGNKAEEKAETETKEKENSDIDIEIDDFNDNSSNYDAEEEKKNKENKENKSDSDVDAFIDDFNEDEENDQSKEKEKETKNEIQKSESDIDIDYLLDENDKKEDQKEVKAEIQKSNSDIEIAVDDFEDENETEDKTQTQTKVQGVTKESRFPFKTDFEVNVDDLSSDNLEEQQKLEYELLPPTSLTEALGFENGSYEKVEFESVTKTETKTEITSITKNNGNEDDILENIDDISMSFSDNDQKQQQKPKDEDSDVDVEIEDDFQDSDDDKTATKEQKEDSNININDISINSEKEEEKKVDSDINIDDISLNSEKEEETKEKSGSDLDIDIDDFAIDSDTADQTDNKNSNNSNSKQNVIKIGNNKNATDFPFKTDFVVNVDDLSSNGIEERPKLDILSLQKQQNQKTVSFNSNQTNESYEKEYEIDIEGEFEIISDDDNKATSQKNTNQVLLNNNERLNQGIDNIADDFYIESDNDIDINDFQDNGKEKDKKNDNEDDEKAQSDGIDVVLDDDFSDENDTKKEQNQNDDDDFMSDDFEIDLGDSN